MTTRATIAATTLRSIAADDCRAPKATIAAILAACEVAGETAAEVEYDALTPETARALLRRAGSDVVPDYADEAAREIVRAQLARNVRDANLRDTRIAILATEAWARAFRAAWPAEDVARLAMTIEPDGFSNDLYVASEDAAPTPPDWMLTDEALIAESMGFDPRQDIASEDAAADYSLDVPTIAETIATARGMLSPRARSGLDALPAA